MKINGDTILKEILEKYPEAMPILARHGFHGITCPAEVWISLKAVSETRGILLKPLLEDLNKLTI